MKSSDFKNASSQYCSADIGFLTRLIVYDSFYSPEFNSNSKQHPKLMEGNIRIARSYKKTLVIYHSARGTRLLRSSFAICLEFLPSVISKWYSRTTVNSPRLAVQWAWLAGWSIKNVRKQLTFHPQLLELDRMRTVRPSCYTILHDRSKPIGSCQWCSEAILLDS